jgi:TonB family protein
MEAPSAPTAEEWAFASKYTLKNSKGYRHSWGKQVRSMMGTAVEGADQGQVRFRIEIAPNGSIVNVETLWKTSDKAEQLARKAIGSMSPLPPTPTGKSLIFEKTISFSPFTNDDSPIYSKDCLPDPPAFINPFTWDGKSPQQIRKNKSAEQLSPEALAECLKQLPQDSIEGVAAHDQRQLDQWGSSRLKQ